jgi:hypothetical protein
MQEEEAEEVTPSAPEEVGAEEVEAALQVQGEDLIITAKISCSANTLTRSLEIDRKCESS